MDLAAGLCATAGLDAAGDGAVPAPDEPVTAVVDALLVDEPPQPARPIETTAATATGSVALPRKTALLTACPLHLRSACARPTNDRLRQRRAA
jgi:hypothetical protein